jgi:hypothetical protein
LSDEETTYSQNKISELETEQLAMLKVAEEQMIIVRSTIQTVNSTLTEVAAKEI